MLRPIFRVLAPPGRRGRLSIFIFHRVLRAPDPLFPDIPDAVRFDEILRWLKSWFNVLPLDRAVRDIAAGTLPARAAAITFDDGYADNLTVALPSLVRHGMTATVFIATEFLDGGCMWNDTVINAIRYCKHTTLDLDELGLGKHALVDTSWRRSAIENVIDRLKYLPDVQRTALAQRIAAVSGTERLASPMMTSRDVQALWRAGIGIGAHTVSHSILAGLSGEEARREMTDGKARLESILGEEVTLFAYPNGKFGKDYNDEHAAFARSIGFAAAVSTDWGAASVDTDLMHLPRFTPWDHDRVSFAARLAANIARKHRSVERP